MRTEIGKLTLRLSGIDSRDGASLAQRIAEGLRATALPQGRHPGDLHITVAQSQGEPEPELSSRIVDQILRQLRRTL